MNKLQRSLFNQAERANKQRESTRGRGPRQRFSVPPETNEQTFCWCLAVLIDGRCPNCREHAAVYTKFCRRCLQVHSSIAECEPWVRSS